MGPFGMDTISTAFVIVVVLVVILLITLAVVSAVERVQVAKYTGRDPRTEKDKAESA